jgi:tetratricopeptide (TPR) repeat protein
MNDRFSNAIALHRAGRLDEAEGEYRSILAAEPDHADSLHLLGVIAQQRGQFNRAAELIEQAIKLHTDRPAYHSNLAGAYRGLGRFDDAITHCRAALALQPNQPEAQLNLGLAHQAAKRWTEAESAFKDFALGWPADHRGPQSLGDCLREQGRTEEAVVAYREALARNPNNGPVHLVLGTILLIGDSLGLAEPHLRRALELLPQSVAAILNLGACLTRLGREREALRIYEFGSQLAPGDAIVGIKTGQALLACGERTKARQLFQAIVDIDPGNADALCGMADIEREEGQSEESLPHYEQSLQVDPTYGAYRGLGDALIDLQMTDRAKAVYRKAVEQYPFLPEAHTRLGTTLAMLGDLEGAVAAYRSALQIQPRYPLALFGLAKLLGTKLPKAEELAMVEALEQPDSANAIASLHYGLAQLEDARDSFAKAAHHARQANALMKSYDESHNRGYDGQRTRQFIDHNVRIYTTEFFARCSTFGHESEQPVFVFGMPRSGTSLVEQILASHPGVFGAGECTFADKSLKRLRVELGLDRGPMQCVEQLTNTAAHACASYYLGKVRQRDPKNSQRIVDKLPDNFLMLGWLATLFPRARFIHCVRDLRDVALSCWMTCFTHVPWSCDLNLIAGRIRDYQRLISHWRTVLPVEVLDVRYEELVADQERQSRRLVEWLGLDWDPGCLEFHRTKRMVQTASVTQVRQPIYTRSIGRWRHYLDDLRPLIDELGLGLN